MSNSFWGMLLAVVAVVLGIGLVKYHSQLNILRNDLINARSELEYRHAINDSTERVYATQLKKQKNLTELAIQRLNIAKDELTGKSRAYSELEVRFQQLTAQLESDTVERIDSLDGRLILSFNEVKKNYPGYAVMVKPRLTLPMVLKVYQDSFKVNTDITVIIEPINVKLLLQELRPDHWETIIQVDSPIFDSFGNVSTVVSPYSETFWDKVNFRFGAGWWQFEKPYLRFGMGYDRYIISGVFSDKWSPEVSVEFQFSDIWK